MRKIGGILFCPFEDGGVCMAMNVRGLLLLRAVPRTADVERGPNSGHHKELNSANHLNEVGEDPEPQLTQ